MGLRRSGIYRWRQPLHGVFQDVSADDFSDVDGVVRAWFSGRLERLRNLHGVAA